MNQDTVAEKFTGLSRDAHKNPIPLTFAKTALKVTRDTSISVSTEITLEVNTSMIEVQTINGRAYLKYGTDDVTNANFDEHIQADSTRHYVIPAGITAINLIDNGDSTEIIVIEK